VDQEFVRVLLVTLAVGFFVAGAGTVMLVFLFRAVAGEKPSELRYAGIAAGLTLFVFICCAIFFALSLR
jgi:hypothetical protein